MMKKLTKKRNQKGFTLVELLIVIAIIGILAAIAIPQFSQYRVRAYNAAALSDLKNAYTAGQAYFGDNPTGTVTLPLLQTNGYNPTTGVTVTVTGGTQAGFALTSTHASGNVTYAMDANGVLTHTP
ncbi:MAG: prepilin-type N-terminal cleavage/methylation domain-containing protein [Thermodesulfobacteriota bacterium]